ncbi:hypothetical protein HZB07_04865 [Candidatus Saganbacteria bacterium]|nr:hypothetical protein [Candidatus Saganbacteria bacterium]
MSGLVLQRSVSLPPVNNLLGNAIIGARKALATQRIYRYPTIQTSVKLPSGNTPLSVTTEVTPVTLKELQALAGLINFQPGGRQTTVPVERRGSTVVLVEAIFLWKLNGADQAAWLAGTTNWSQYAGFCSDLAKRTESQTFQWLDGISVAATLANDSSRQAFFSGVTLRPNSDLKKVAERGMFVNLVDAQGKLRPSSEIAATMARLRATISS